MKKIRNIIYCSFVLLITIGFLSFSVSTGFAERLTHTVEKGDTLWDICEKYYGDSSVWPKLWQLNSFITNPHLLIPGEIITLYELEELQDTPEVKEPPQTAPEPDEPDITGINVAGLTTVDMLGFLSAEKITPWGMILATDDDRNILSTGDTAYVLFEKGKKINTGDRFSIGKTSPLIKNPIGSGSIGYVFSVNGILVIEEKLGLARIGKELYEKENVFRATIVKANEPITINDPLMPARSIPPCIKPVSVDKNILANIVASKGQQMMIHQGSIVYLNAGSNEGIKRGHLFEVVEGNFVPDPKPEGISLYKSLIILPDNHVGRILVLETEPETSTAVVLSSKKPISTGDYVKDISWTETPDFIKLISICTIE